MMLSKEGEHESKLTEDICFDEEPWKIDAFGNKMAIIYYQNSLVSVFDTDIKDGD